MSGCCHRVINLSALHIERNRDTIFMSNKILLSLLLLLLFGELANFLKVIVEPLTLDMLFLKILQTNISSYK